MPSRHVPVLVVGGSLVGLSTSVLLAHHGVPHLLVEHHAGTAIHPRAASFHQRTMEVFRSVGIQQAVEDAAALEFVQNGAIVAVESLAGKQLATFFANFNDGVEDLSPTSRIFITQVGLEPILRDRAVSLGAEHLYDTELVSLTEHHDHVVAVLRPRSGGEDIDVVAEHVVAADGAHSRIREQLGIPLAGHGDVADCVTIYFRADLRTSSATATSASSTSTTPACSASSASPSTAHSGFLAVFATFDATAARQQVGDDLAPSDASSSSASRSVLTDLPVEIERRPVVERQCGTPRVRPGGCSSRATRPT